MKTAAMVIWYNPTKNEKENIHTYLEEVSKLYIIDNSEVKNSYYESEKIEYIFNNDNVGVATALNIGVKKAIGDKYKWLITLDQDTTFKGKDITNILNKMQKFDLKNIGIITPWHNTKLHIKKPDLEIDYPLDVMTSGNFLNLDIYNVVGNFKDEYFIDGIDIDYCLRLKKYGYKIMRFNEYEIDHNLGNIFYKNFLGKEFYCSNHNYLRVYYRIRNYNYIKKEYENLEPTFCKRLVKIKMLIWCIVFYEKDKYRKLRSIILGKKDYKKNIYGKYNH